MGKQTKMKRLVKVVKKQARDTKRRAVRNAKSLPDSSIHFNENELPVSLNLVVGLVMGEEGTAFAIGVKDCTLATGPGVPARAKEVIAKHTAKLTVDILKTAIQNYITAEEQKRNGGSSLILPGQ